MSDYSRRDILRAAGVMAGASLIPKGLLASNQDHQDLPMPQGYEYKKPARPLTGIVIGYGGRGGLYGHFSTQMPDDLKIIGVAEPIEYRRKGAIDRHGITPGNTFTTWEHVFDRPKFADVVLICTPDNLHYEPVMAALEMGYDVLLEKPVAQTWEQCKAILDLANAKGRTVAICHVLRYAPYYVQLKNVIDTGMIGDVVSIQHMEPIQHMHMAHSYVRGPWRRRDESNPILLAKSCHDLDILRWWVGKPCERVSSFGSRSVFRPENAPEGAPKHCMDGCPVEETCPYHAANVYVHKKQWSTHHIVTPDRSEQGILKELRKGQYGQCVYHADNDVCDHQVVNMEFQGGITAAFSLEAMTQYAGRRTRVMGTRGDIVGDEHILEIHQFWGGKTIRWDVNQAAKDLGGHGGGDIRLLRDFTQAVSRQDQSLLTSNLAASMESHQMGFQADVSRQYGGRAMPVRM